MLCRSYNLLNIHYKPSTFSGNNLSPAEEPKKEETMAGIVLWSKLSSFCVGIRNWSMSKPGGGRGNIDLRTKNAHIHITNYHASKITKIIPYTLTLTRKHHTFISYVTLRYELFAKHLINSHTCCTSII